MLFLFTGPVRVLSSPLVFRIFIKSKSRSVLLYFFLSYFFCPESFAFCHAPPRVISKGKTNRISLQLVFCFLVGSKPPDIPEGCLSGSRALPVVSRRGARSFSFSFLFPPATKNGAERMENSGRILSMHYV